ncbi:MAG: cupin domain-containing protein [Candidatus Aminicenantales bacterium]|jgi:mannose-6-phosphate isomerase-like protein (cupin superfamily)
MIRRRIASAEVREKGLISGIGLTELTVYDQRPAPDGADSGSPHVHAVTDEGYYVMSGSGRVELHDLERGFRTVELTPGRYLQFPPGALHRLVSTNHLVILVVMGNAGLAEHGDARIYFGRRVDENPAEYARLFGLAQAKGLEGALDRRDAAVRAYQALVELWTKDKAAYYADLKRFIGVHFQTAAGLREEFSRAVGSGPVAWGERFRRRLEHLPLGREEPAPVLHIPVAQTSLGMCGLLRPVTKLEPVDPGNAPGPNK